eukprot:CAMPEP_0116005404 /NCGR_PEP_ID=MMETSP0321-20121206/1147_1 /TAXON_ID=163516 /ORGANISM="Leptocylindrus danicus var. danicus, Strain B650" /LENGTH=516 /DNA_ID=CAMNT_0003473829 /DNA_START=167 /DNA_END=1717 /DNA_ORIENTATION=-
MREDLWMMKMNMDERLGYSTLLTHGNNAQDISSVPTFDANELHLGPLLGVGGFCAVSEIQAIKLKKGNVMTDSNNAPYGKNHPSRTESVATSQTTFPCSDIEDTDESNEPPSASEITQSSRVEMSLFAIRKGDARYAIKKIKDEIYDFARAIDDNDDEKFSSAFARMEARKKRDKFMSATLDLAVEAQYLAALSHPNLIKMRGVASCDPFSGNYFLILDRLYGTLDDKIQEWKNRIKSSGIGCIGKNKEDIKDIWLERLNASYGLAAALKHLHSHKIVYRDLKPENSGFDVRGDIKLFDLGLATELYPHLEVEEGLYQLTGHTGSLRYMAPEVRWSELYNLRADVYSYGLVFWQICALKRPFENYTREKVDRKVLKEGIRPKSQRSWFRRTAWYDMMQQLWAHDQADRPEFTTVCEWLASEIDIVSGDDIDGESTMKRLETRRSLNSIYARTASSSGRSSGGTGGMWRSLIRSKSSTERNSASSRSSRGFGLGLMGSSFFKSSAASIKPSAKAGGD